MYKVIIVDDEMVVRVGLKSFVDWEALGYVFAGEAGNGEEALALCRNIKPDVVLTDLKMPKMDGMEFIKALLLEQPGVKIVILSCIDEFDTLQQSLRLGIKDYFLKLSFSPEQLVLILKKLKKELDLQSNNATASIEKLSSIREVAIAKESFYKNLIATQANKIPASTEAQISVNSETDSNAFMLLLSRDIRYEEDLIKIDENYSQKFTIINLINEILSKEFICDIVEVEKYQFMAVCKIHDVKHEKIFTIANEIQSNLIRIMNYSVTIAVNLYDNCCDNFYKSYQMCMEALQQRFYEGHKSIIFYERNSKASANGTLSSTANEIERKIQEQLEYFEFEQPKQIVLEFLDRTAAEKKWLPMEFRKYFPGLVDPWYRIYKHFNNGCTRQSDITSPYIRMEHFQTISDLRKWFLEYVNNIEVHIKDLLKSSKVRTEIELAKKYIENNYSESININDVASMAGFNSSYFSHLFKKETGEGFLDYLSKVRLSNALKLLKETSYSINQISEMVGYNDVAYFRKQFRKFYHKSPSECRD